MSLEREMQAFLSAEENRKTQLGKQPSHRTPPRTGFQKGTTSSILDAVGQPMEDINWAQEIGGNFLWSFMDEASLGAVGLVDEYDWLEMLNNQALEIEFPKIDIDLPSCLYYSSGTTTSPKSVLVSHRNMLRNIGSIVEGFRFDENEDLPVKSTIGKKSSDIVGKAKISPSKYFNISYNFSLDNNLESSNYDSVKTTLSLNNFVTSFEFLQEQGDIGNESFIKNNTSYNFDEENSLNFSTRKNKVTNLTEFYNLIYQYKNDCLVAGIEYSKAYYSTATIKPEQQIFFSITIVPFGKATSPGINR